MNEKNVELPKVNLVILCTDKNARLIIGKGGFNIKENTQKSNCQISIRGQYGRERFVAINGTPANVAVAACYIAQVIVKHNMGFQDLDLSSNDSSHVMVVLVPTKVCGAIIGHHGENIKNIRDVSKTSMKIVFDKTAASGHNILIIEGEPEQIQKAVELVASLQAQLISASSDLEGLTVDVPAVDEDQRFTLISETFNHGQYFVLDNEVARIIIGKKGSTIKTIRAATGAYVTVNEVNQNKSKIEVIGSISSVEMAVRLIDAEISYELNSGKNNQRQSRGGAYNYNGNNNNRHRSMKNQDGKGNSVKISDENNSDKITAAI